MEILKKSPRNLAISVGGHATLDPRVKDQRIEVQEAAMEKTVKGILEASMLAAEKGYGFNLMNHGSGPQTGIILKRAYLSEKYGGMHPLPLDYISADLIGSIGTVFARMIRNAVRELGGSEKVLGFPCRDYHVTPVHFLVDPLAKTTRKPVKPIGEMLTEEEAEAKKKQFKEKGENCDVFYFPDKNGWRIRVPSPVPLKAVEINAIRAIIKAGIFEIAGGTGGIAVVSDEDGKLKPVPGVIDKDYAISMILQQLMTEGETIPFDTLAILTNAPCACKNWGQPNEEKIGVISSPEMEDLYREGHFKEGSMGPKVRAGLDFIEAGGKNAIITTPEELIPALLDRASPNVSTRILKGERWI